MKEYKQVLANKNFFLLWLGQGVSNIGNRINGIALIWLITGLANGTKGVSLLFILLSIPSIVIGPVAGVLVERWSKKKVIVVTDVMRGLLALAIACCADSIGLVYLFSFLSALCGVFFQPAISTAIPRIVDKKDLMTANALSSLTSQIASLGGPALGGMVIGFFSVKAAFIVNGCSFLMSALSELWITVPSNSKEKQSKVSIMHDFREGWDYIRQNETVKFVVVFFALLSLPMSAPLVLRNVLLKETLSFSAQQFGLIMTISSIGLLLGTLYMGKWGRMQHEVRSMVVGVVGIGIGYLILSFSTSLWLAAVVMAVIGFCGTIVNIAYFTYLQKVVADEVRSRVFSFDIAVGESVSLLAFALAGILGDAFGVANSIMASGALIIVLAVGTLFLPIYARVVEKGIQAIVETAD